jgi:type IV pilus assembly protein PilY1
MKPHLGSLSTLVVALTTAFASPAFAEDIDIYSTVGANSDLPNVLLMLDNSANWSASIPTTCYYNDASGKKTTDGPKASNPGMEQGTKMGVEKCALYNVIQALPVKASGGADNDAEFNVGLMLLNESPSSNNGGYPRRAFIPMTTNNKTKLMSVIKNLSIGNDKGNNAAFAKAMYEMYLYFNGKAQYKGKAGTKYDASAFSGDVYISPAAGGCGRNHIIFIGNGSPEGAENNDALALLQAAGGSTEPLGPYPYSYISKSEQANWADEYARFMRTADVSSKDGTQFITTHTVAVTGASSDGTFPNFMLSMANAGGGTYTSASDADTLTRELLKIFNSIQSVNSVFASVSLPVAVNARGTYLNQVYMGVFRPDGDAKPRWRGNLKQYQFSADALGNLSLVDSNNEQAINDSTGFIKPSAVSFWTAASTFWKNLPTGDGGASDKADGDVVEKGGAGQRLRTRYATSQEKRQVFTCLSCASGTTLGGASATLFNHDNSGITAAKLGVTDSSREDLIDWVRGKDNAGDELGPGGDVNVRPSIHGDVLHSRPAVINFGGTTGVVVFYGANDGMLHALDGNRTGSTPGDELWSFVPEEMFGKLKRLRNNDPEVRLSTTVSTTATPRDYFVDGPIGVYQRLAADGSTSRAIIYVGMRRGGRQLYAIDVTTPTAPKFLWKKTEADLPRLGETWSEPKVVRVRGYDKPVVIFGGGYDAAAEDSAVQGTTTMGNSVFVLDAYSGTLLHEFSDMKRSVAADVVVVDSDYDGYIDRAYAVDLSGAVWRLDFESPASGIAPDSWVNFQIADLSGGTKTERKFFYPPSVVLTKNFAALMFGSGDREKPLLSATQDHFFTIFDRNLEKGKPAEPTLITFDSLVPVGDASMSTGNGCYIELEQGEKVVNGATTIGGKSHFGTNQPKREEATNTCTGNLGTARGYTMPLFCIKATFSEYPGGGLPPSPISGIVTITRSDGSTGQHHFFTGGDQKLGALAPSDPKIKIGKSRKRLYWYQDSSR